MVEQPSVYRRLSNLFLTIWPSLFVLFFHETCSNPKYKCSLQYSLKDLPTSILVSLKHLDPTSITWNSTAIITYHFWILLQLALYYLIPPFKVVDGTPTPASTVFKYRCNGYLSFIVSNVIMFILMLYGWIDGNMFHNNFYAFLWLSNIYGFLLAFFVYIKAHLFPTSPNDCVFTECSMYNFYMGIEHSPRILGVDLKMFFNTRTGIAAWPLINLSLTISYILKNFTLDYSIIGVVIVQYIYVIDLFYHEAWYVHTIDIAHDHFGFYLAWGDMVWLPFMYTLQCRYLTFAQIYLSRTNFCIILVTAIVAYILFRWSNNQRRHFRQAIARNQHYEIWGTPATYIKAFYTTNDGQHKHSYLLTSGFWGVCRHFNYLADLVLSLCSCLFCGFHHLFPYFYFFYMVILLMHRIHRDDLKCKAKYGKYWDQYCQIVPYKLIPYIY